MGNLFLTHGYECMKIAPKLKFENWECMKNKILYLKQYLYKYVYNYVN